MARRKLREGDQTVRREFKLSASDADRIDAHLKRLGGKKKFGEVCRLQMLKWLRSQDVMVRAAERSQKSFPIVAVASKKKKRRALSRVA